MLRPATRKELSTKPPKYLVDEIDRLLKLEEKSNQELLENIESLQLDSPPAIRNILDPEAANRQVEEVKTKRSEANCASQPGLVAPKPSRRICGKRPFADCTFHILEPEIGATRKVDASAENIRRQILI